MSALSDYRGQYHLAPIELLTRENLLEDVIPMGSPAIVDFEPKALERIPKDVWTEEFLEQLKTHHADNGDCESREVVLWKLASNDRLDIIKDIKISLEKFGPLLGDTLLSNLTPDQLSSQKLPRELRVQLLTYTKAIQTNAAAQIEHIAHTAKEDTEIQEQSIKIAREAGIRLAQGVISHQPAKEPHAHAH